MGPKRRTEIESSELFPTLAGLAGVHADFHTALAAGHAVLDGVESGIPGADVNRVTTYVNLVESDLQSMIGLLEGLNTVRLDRLNRRLVRRLKATIPDLWSSLAGLDARARRLGRLDSKNRT